MKDPRVHLFFSSGIILGLILLGFVKVLSAQDEENNIESTVNYTFGQELRFSLGIANASNIEKISLYVRPRLVENYYLIDIPFDPGQTISITYSLPVKRIELRPFTIVNYFWEVNDGNGNQRTAEDTFYYEDDRFVWQQMTKDAATVHWTGSGPFFGQDVLTVADEALDKLTLLLPIDQISPYDIYVYPSSADLRAALRLAEINAGATAHPNLGVILVTAVNPQTAITDLGQSLPYELSQLLLFSVSGDNYDNIPWWIREGIGITVQTQISPRFAQLLDEAVAANQTIPLPELCIKTERVGDRTLLASAQSYSIVEYILRRYGDQTLSDLITTYIQGDSCDVGVRRVIGISLEELEEDWLNFQKGQNPVSHFMAQYGIWLLLFLSGTVIMIMIISSTRRQSI